MQKRLEVYLIRHGESAGNALNIFQGTEDYPLTELGREQAEALGAALRSRDVQPTAIYSSDRARTRDTAKIIGRCLEAREVREEAALRETDFGPLTGLTLQQAAARWPAEIARYASGTALCDLFEGAESWADAQKRARRVLRTIRARHPEGVVLVVSHGLLLLNMHKAILRVPPAHKLLLRIPNAGYSRFIFEGDSVWLGECSVTAPSFD